MTCYYYRLIGRLAVPCSREQFADVLIDPALRRVAETNVGPLWVSTVFLGLNHAIGTGPPLIFETMIFDDMDDGYQTRCSTWEEAEAQHAEAVAIAEERVASADALLRPASE